MRRLATSNRNAFTILSGAATHGLVDDGLMRIALALGVIKLLALGSMPLGTVPTMCRRAVALRRTLKPALVGVEDFHHISQLSLPFFMFCSRFSGYFIVSYRVTSCFIRIFHLFTLVFTFSRFSSMCRHISYVVSFPHFL